MQSEYFSLNRSPGGTFGNRNFVAHLAAIGLPVILLVTRIPTLGLRNLLTSPEPNLRVSLGAFGEVTVSPSLVFQFMKPRVDIQERVTSCRSL